MSHYKTNRTLLIFLQALFICLGTNAQTFKRQANETANHFVKRITKFTDDKPNTIIETKEWDTSRVMILAFIPTPDEITLGLLYVPTDGFSYRQILIDSFSTRGNTAQIEHVFFANADNDDVKELVVMTTYDKVQDQQTRKVYWNLVFDNPNFSELPRKLSYLSPVSKKINGYQFKKPLDIETAVNHFHKDLPFEILSSQKGTTDQSSDKNVNQCANWSIPEIAISGIIKDCKIISGSKWHDDFGVFPCIISGQLKQNGKVYKFEINAGSWMYIYSAEQTLILGSYKKQHQNYFLAPAWDGK